MVAAKGAEEAIDRADESRRPALQQEAYDAYRRLSERLGDSPEVLAGQKNAQVACSKWAYYAGLLGRHGEAAEQLDRLLKAFPDNRDYLRRAGLAYFQAGNYERSLAAWRTLLAGLEKGSEGWYEAKYYQLSCLFRTDEKAARPVWQQFKLLYPELGPPPWRGRVGSS